MGGLYLADLGFFALWRLQRLAKRREGGQIERRKGRPSTVQLLLEGLDWQLTLTSCLWGVMNAAPPTARLSEYDAKR